ncbi:predicted protein [Botrytis cinerea T4]|uniref:Uncharacterized protein n=1 Tax=Botryotinia fuckeliana (strain T4) TaxID=999810 RepID=G2YB76_BOTF4|nr:predicted protein [Botrytis cinerea T4]
MPLAKYLASLNSMYRNQTLGLAIEDLYHNITISMLSATQLINGVAHGTAFSALVATTRNSELDALSKFYPRVIAWAHCLLNKRWQRLDWGLESWERVL